ncbi:uncharacterized protein [Parasteatoda tepidariorum]|uniref:uncharacterized protein n=1 Tax=Parasteatoda tepidariorum TaxID=114398 RepID=UPI001C72302F|nr:uncharacterized protein LOC107453673 [Parasteatoda tepidariorum]
MKSAVLFWFLCGIWAIMLFCSVKAEERSVDKRYIAALAKNNRLPKFSYVHKKSEESDDEPSMEQTQLFLNQIVEPDNMYHEKNWDVSSFLEPSQNGFLESSPLSELNFLADQAVEKRNVAALARLGRLNTIRYGRFQPHYVNGKRLSNEDDNEEANQEITDNEIDGNDIDCLPDDDEETLSEITAEVNGRQKKRYVAALARSGRLPIWHSQRMWSGKRDDAYPSYKSNSRMDIENNLDNFIGEVPDYIKKLKRCKKINQYKREKRNVDKMKELEDIPIENINLSGLNNPEEKRNLAALARNGKLPSRYFGDGKRSDEKDTSEDFSGEKRNIASLVRNGKLFNSRVEGKRNLAALARNGKLPQFGYEGKRNIAALARNGKLFASSNMDGKRNVASLARNGKLPSFSENKGKRNLAALARNGKLPTFYDNEGKRNLAALARNGKLPSFYSGNGKRNIQALARNNKLPAFENEKRDSMESDDKRNLAALAKNGRLPSFAHIDDKRNMAALAKNGRLPTFHNVDDKRNIATLARDGKLPAFALEDKRNLAALARNGKLPMFDSREDKRNIAALAKNGKLPTFYSPEEKRNIAALAKNGKLPSFYSSGEKRDIAAYAQNGKLPAFNSIEEKREIIPVSGIYNEEDKRNIAALARKGHLMQLNDQGKKRNIAALARNGKLYGYNKRDVYTTNSLNPLEKWDDMIFQDDIEM